MDAPKASETIVTVRKIGMKRGFHAVNVDENDANAILRGDKTAVVIDAMNVQKGDWLVFDVHDGLVHHSHELSDAVFEVTFVDVVGHDEHTVVACFRRLEGYLFHRGDISDLRFREDSVVVR